MIQLHYAPGNASEHSREAWPGIGEAESASVHSAASSDTLPASRREVASYEERRSYRAERDYQYSSRYAQVERNYGSGGNSDGGRSAGQLMSDNLRPL